MNAPSRALNVKTTTVPANNESIVVLDSTRRLFSGTQASIASGSAYLAPGNYRNAWAGAIVRYTVKATTQNVTATEQLLTGAAGTSADWETGAAGSHTVTAGTTYNGEWKPQGADWRLKIDAGATGPSAIVVNASVVFGEDFGT